MSDQNFLAKTHFNHEGNSFGKSYWLDYDEKHLDNFHAQSFYEQRPSMNLYLSGIFSSSNGN